MITYQVYDPGTAANPNADLYKCEVRSNSFIADWQYFDTKGQAEDWGKNHDGKASEKAANLIFAMIKRWASK